MNKLTAWIVTAALVAGVSVCSAEPAGAGSDTSVICKDGVCELPSVRSAGSGRTALDSETGTRRNATPEVTVNWERDVQPGTYDLFVASQTEPRVGVLFTAKRPVKNFKILSLHLKDMGNDGKPVFLYNVLYTKDVLRPERPLLVRITLIGSIPNNGFCYEDGSGKVRHYSVSESGMDGSVIINEF